jgi:membrane-associated phospholipid phosphatase
MLRRVPKVPDVPKMPKVLAITLVIVAASGRATLAQTTDAATPSTPSVPSAPSERSLFIRLFTTLGRDLKNLPSRDNAPILLGGAALAIAMLPLDDDLTLAASSSPTLKRTYSGWGKAMGREWVQGGGALAAYVAGSMWDKPRMTEAAGDLIEAQLVAVTATQALKFAFNRDRPDREARSFPSGHASAAFATARVLQQHFGRRLAIPAYAVAVFTSTSRLQANSHYTSDVIFGAALGLAIAHTATADRRERGLHVVPTVSRDSVAITFTLK